MIHKYRIDFRFESGILLAPYDEEGIIIEAHTAEDALTQARIEIDWIIKQSSILSHDGAWSGRWFFTKIAPLPEIKKKGE
jgi:hypothetical protein